MGYLALLFAGLRHIGLGFLVVLWFCWLGLVCFLMVLRLRLLFRLLDFTVDLWCFSYGYLAGVDLWWVVYFVWELVCFFCCSSCDVICFYCLN